MPTVHSTSYQICHVVEINSYCNTVNSKKKKIGNIYIVLTFGGGSSSGGRAELQGCWFDPRLLLAECGGVIQLLTSWMSPCMDAT